MSEENGKVCCNCRHNKRYHDEGGMIYCECEVSGDWLSYVRVMTGWCRHWAKESEEDSDEVVALEFSTDVDTSSKYQTRDGEWHTGRIPTTNGEE